MDGAERSAAAFETLADPTRVALLRALWTEGGQGAVSFSTLRDAVDVGDSGRFNYHLQRLADEFVEKTDDGYRLRPAGIAVIDTVYSGMMAPPDDVEPRSIDARCSACDDHLTFAYDHGYAVVRCDGCGRVLSKFLFPPRGITGRESADEVAAAFDAHVRSAIDRTAAGVCPYCAGRISFESFAGLDSVPEGLVSLLATCADCQGRLTASVASVLSLEPSVVSFLHDHGVDVRAPLWTQEWYHGIETAVSGDPPVVEAVVPVGEDVLHLTIDESGAVLDTSRSDR